MSRTNIASRRLVVTGVGFRAGTDASDTDNVFMSPSIKPNIGAAVALEGARSGYAVVIVSRTASKLDRIADSIKDIVSGAEVETCPADLLDAEAIRRLAKGLPTDRELDMVHSAGLSAGSYKLEDDNPYLDVATTPLDLPTLEFESVVKTLLVAVQSFLPRWRSQQSSRLVVVSSMSGIRPVPFAYSHISAKAAVHQAVRGLTLELNTEGITVSEVLPGIVDTGLYDTETVRSAAQRIARSFAYQYEPDFLPQMSPQDVAAAVMLCLTSGAHILSVAMVSQGQFPHHGA